MGFDVRPAGRRSGRWPLYWCKDGVDHEPSIEDPGKCKGRQVVRLVIGGGGGGGERRRQGSVDRRRRPQRPSDSWLSHPSRVTGDGAGAAIADVSIKALPCAG